MNKVFAVNHGDAYGAGGHTEGGSTAPGLVWAKACGALKPELGDDKFGSWLAQATVSETALGGAVMLVTPTRTARDWVRSNVWRRVSELWAEIDPQHRTLNLTCKAEFEIGSGRPAASITVLETAMGTDKAEGPRAKAPAGASICAPIRADETRVRAARSGGLRDHLIFDTFVAGPANEFAHDIARRVACWSDGHFNPVVFHGPYGFGKTHLLNAIAWEAMRLAPSKKVIYLTAEGFLSNFVRAMMDRSGPAFKEELRAADLLLIDDVHFIAGKQSSQEELYHTLTALTQEGRRVVFTSDRAPTTLIEMDARLRSHLQAGLVCGIEPADRNLRLGILERKLDLLARQQGFARLAARPEVLQFLADRFTDSVRELEGALNTLVARTGDGVGRVGLEEAQAILRPHLRGGGEKRITIDDIQKATAEHYGMKQVDLISERRNRAIARPRQAAMWLAKQLTTRSLPDIGRRFGGRDHTTVLHAVRRIEALKGEDAQLARDLEILARKLRG